MSIHKTKIKTIWLCGIAMLGCVQFVRAQTASRANVVSQLSAFKVVSDTNGEKLVSAEKIAPGEVIEYQVRYANTGTRGAKNLQAILPIPAALELVPDSASPATTQASLDGKTFATMPLKRTVKAADGSEKVVVVPPSEYRYLRWNVASLDAGQSVQIAARARLAKVGTTTR